MNYTLNCNPVLESEPVASLRLPRKNVSGVSCHATRKLPFGAIAAAHWLMSRPVDALVCIYPGDGPSS